MTGPIIYDPIPNPTLANLADGVDAFGDVSTTSRINFDKLNTRLRGASARWTVFSDRQEKASLYSGFSNWTSILDWPAKTIHLPGRVAGALLIVRGQANSGSIGSYPQLAFCVDVTGPGVSVPIPTRESICLAALWGLVDGCRQWWFRPDDLVESQDVTITPMVTYNDTSNAYVNYAEWLLAVFSGDPS